MKVWTSVSSSCTSLDSGTCRLSKVKSCGDWSRCGMWLCSRRRNLSAKTGGRPLKHFGGLAPHLFAFSEQEFACFGWKFERELDNFAIERQAQNEFFLGLQSA